MSRGPVTLLVDNGSLAPAATLRLRELARAFAARLGADVRPVSLLHSDQVPAGDLGGVAADTLEPYLERAGAVGAREYIVVPCFIGPSRAVTDFLPARVNSLRQRHPALRVRVAAPLHAAGDDRLVTILGDHVAAVARALPAAGVRPVALVDHGSPEPAVTAVRDELAAALQSQLGAGYRVGACSMERREGAEFDFNEPLLGRLLGRPPWNGGDVIVALEFLLPGRHAGPAGDVAEICRRAAQASPGLRLHPTPLLGDHPLLVEILADRWRAAMAAE